jgi:membrane protease YdiL (CAAX protease family)
VWQFLLVSAFIAVILLTGELRRAAYAPSILREYAGFATPLYVGATVLFALLLGRAGVRLNRVGFGLGLRLSHILMGVGGAIVLKAIMVFLGPALETAFGAERDLSRFSNVAGSLTDMLGLMALSWTVAAVGEEIAFRIVMMRGVASALGDSAAANIAALVVQAVIFGLVHAYQGPAAVAGTMLSGLIYGSLVIAARGAIWPAVVAHGLNNTFSILILYSEG